MDGWGWMDKVIRRDGGSGRNGWMDGKSEWEGWMEGWGCGRDGEGEMELGSPQSHISRFSRAVNSDNVLQHDTLLYKFLIRLGTCIPWYNVVND